MCTAVLTCVKGAYLCERMCERLLLCGRYVGECTYVCCVCEHACAVHAFAHM